MASDLAGDAPMTIAPGYQAIHIYGEKLGGSVKVDMGVTGRRPISFAGLMAAIDFVDHFAVDKVTVRIKSPGELSIPGARAVG